MDRSVEREVYNGLWTMMKKGGLFSFFQPVVPPGEGLSIRRKRWHGKVDDGNIGGGKDEGDVVTAKEKAAAIIEVAGGAIDEGGNIGEDGDD